jgi:class 3 adenylate cyclase
VVSRFHGYVAQYLGDGALVYFGYPEAREDGAERAVHAGLALVSAVRALRPGADVEPQCRIGIATGLVVDLIGQGAAREQPMVGETPNLAARLQALAEPNTVVIGLSTRRLIGGLFQCRDLGIHELKGFAEPVRAWRVMGRGRRRGPLRGVARIDSDAAGRP